MPGQDVQNDTGRMDIMRQRLGTSGFYRINPIGQHGAQDVDHPLPDRALRSNVPRGCRSPPG